MSVDEVFTFFKRKLAVCSKICTHPSAAYGNHGSETRYVHCILITLDRKIVVRKETVYSWAPTSEDVEGDLLQALGQMIASGLVYNDKAQQNYPGSRRSFNYRQEDIVNPATVLWPISN